MAAKPARLRLVSQIAAKSGRQNRVSADEVNEGIAKP
jgi:hypothetical protein